MPSAVVASAIDAPDDERSARADQGAGEDVAAEMIGAEPAAPRPAAAGAGAVLIVR